MSKKNPVNRIPFESITTLDKWPLPSMEEGSALVSAVKQNESAEKGERIEDVTSPVEHKPMTADQLREITEAAEQEGYQEGFTRGEQEGLRAGRERGEQEGRSAAYEETRAQLDEEKARLQQICAALMEPLEKQDRAVEDTVVDIALGLARHIIDRELSADPGALYAVVSKALESLPMGARDIRIFLNPEDRGDIEALFSAGAHDWVFFVDHKLARGGCRVESSDSLVDFSVEKRLADYLKLIPEQGQEADVEPAPDLRSPEGPTATAEPETSELQGDDGDL